MDRKFLITPANILYFCLMIAIPVVCVSGVSIYPANLRMIATIGTGVLCLIFTLTMQKNISFNIFTIPMLLLCGFMLVSIMYSIDMNNTAQFVAIYFSCTMLLFVKCNESFFDRVLFVIKIFCVVIAISILLSALIDNFMVNYFSFIVNPRHYSEITEAIYKEINYSHAYSGLAMERAEAAYIMNVGIAIIFAKYFSGKRLKAFDVIMLVLFIVALVLSNKRTLFMIPIIVFAFLMLFGSIKSKLLKFSAIIMISVSAFMIFAAFIPQFSNLYDRFFISDSTDILNGRGTLWVYSLSMFAKSPLFGMGFGGFNEFAYDNGLLINGEKWNYYGHNCYYELLGEMGIVGTILFAFAFIVPLVYTFAMLAKKTGTQNQKSLTMFSFYIQMMFIVYSFSGNVIYYTQQVMLWFFAIAIIIYVRNKNGFRLLKKAEAITLENR